MVIGIVILFMFLVLRRLVVHFDEAGEEKKLTIPSCRSGGFQLFILLFCMLNKLSCDEHD